MTEHVRRGQRAYEKAAAGHVADLFGAVVASKPARAADRRALKPKGKKQPARKLDMAPTKIPRPKNFVPIACMCCGRQVDVPALDIIIDHYGVPPAEARILEAVWRGKGHPVQTERIFDAMYADDPDGGPSPGRMYAAFKFGLHRLRCRLAGSGVNIENVGYRQGYRLVLGREVKGQ